MENKLELEISMKAANNIRILSAAMVEEAKSGHPGGSMGGADFMHILLSRFLVFDPENPTWFFRDRFFLDSGHLSPLLYSSFSLLGTYSMQDLKNFRKWDSITPGHPEVDFSRRVENTSGPLGQGHANAVGAAIVERFFAERFGAWTSHKTYTYVSDGSIQEEISQGVGRIAGHLGLNNLIMFYDSNDMQLSSPTDVASSENTAKKYEAWKWRVYTINGNDHQQLTEALQKAHDETERPVLIIGKTIMGKGALTDSGNSKEADYTTHGQPLSSAGASFEKTICNLGGNPHDPFVIFSEVAEYYQQVLDKNRNLVSERIEFQRKWVSENPLMSSKLNRFIENKFPSLNYDEIVQKEDTATRNASAQVLSYYADHIENLIVSSADLSNSDKTDAFLKKTTAFAKGNFTGQFLQAGVAELTMASIANGMALHGGVIPACATFFVFSDFMKPAVRLAALMELQVIYIWTHDSFRVGEDGPTHQPIEHEAQIRLMEQLQNHSGKNSLLALRPADAAETTIAWKIALENQNTPTALILSRQNIKDLPGQINTRKKEAESATRGAYFVKYVEGEPDILFIGSGSEVSTLYEAAELLEKKEGLKVNVISVISEGLFRQQSEQYQTSIIMENVPIIGLTAGLPSTLSELVGRNGKCLGLNHFGYSAPASVLNEKFGFTTEKICEEALLLLSKVKH